MQELTQLQTQILEKWKTVIAERSDALHIWLGRIHHRIGDINRQIEVFIKNPTEENFTGFWDKMDSAMRTGRATTILSKWHKSGRSLKELALLAEEIKNAISYDPSWERELCAHRTLGEFFGSLHLETNPIINGCTIKGLEFFGFRGPWDYLSAERKFNEFKKTYLRIVGHATKDTDHEAPINLEIDQLFNVVDKVRGSDSEKEIYQDVRELYQLVVGAKEEKKTSLV